MIRSPLLAAALGVGLTLSGWAVAQEAPPATTTVRVGHAAWPVTLPNDEPLVLWVAQTSVNPAGQFATADIFVQTSEGAWVQMTPCDNLVVICHEVTLRMTAVTQGQEFFLQEAP